MASKKVEAWWADLRGGPEQAARAIAALSAARATPRSPGDAAALLTAAEQQRRADQPAVEALALGLLARWARLQVAQPVPAAAAVLFSAAQLCTHELVTQGLGGPISATTVLLAGAVSRGLNPSSRTELADVLGRALLVTRQAEVATAGGIAAGTMALLASLLLDATGAACQLLGALLHYLSLLADGDSATLAALVPLYGGMRAATAGALVAGAADAVPNMLQPAYSVLRGGDPGPQSAARQAATVLVLGGLMEGLLRGAGGYLDAQQLAGAAEGDLLGACAAAEAAGGGGGAVAGSSLCIDACSLATMQLMQGARRPLMTEMVFRCQALSLLQSALSLRPFCAEAAGGNSPEAASDLLRRQLQTGLGQHAAAVARGLADQYPTTADPAMHSWLMQQLVAAAQQAYMQYAAYSVQTPAGWMQAVDGQALRQLLERVFLSAMLLLDATWRVAGSHQLGPAHPAQALAAATMVGILANLQFCRVPMEQYGTLLREALAVLPGDPEAAATVAGGLPQYAEVAGPCSARDGAPRWVADAVTAAKIQFVFTVLVTCCRQLPEVVVSGHVAPLVFLYLLHPHQPTAVAAHQLFCALMTSQPERQREPLAPYYIKRSLEGLPGPTPVAQLGQGLLTIMQALPGPANPVALLCLERVLNHCHQLAGHAAGHNAIAVQLFSVACQALLVAPYALLDSTLSLVEECMSGIPAEAQVELAAVLYDAISHCDDCLRKPTLVAWYQQVAARAEHASRRSGASAPGQQAASGSPWLEVSTG